MENVLKSPKRTLSRAQVETTKFKLVDYFRKQRGTSHSTSVQKAITLPDSLSVTNPSFFHKKGGLSIASPTMIPNRLEKLSHTHKEDLSARLATTDASFNPANYTIGPHTARLNHLDKKEFRERKIMYLENKVALKAHFDKYPLSTREAPIATRSDINKVFKFLKLIEEVDSDLSELMDQIIEALKSVIYANYKVVEASFDQTKFEGDEELSKLFQTFHQKNVPYHMAWIELLRIVGKRNAETIMTKESFTDKIKELEDLMKQKDTTIEEMNKKLGLSVPSQLYNDALGQVDEMRDYYREVSYDNEVLRNRYNELHNEHIAMRNQYEREVERAEKQELKLKTLEYEKERLITEAERAKETLQEMQIKVKGLKDIMDKVLVKLGMIKEEVVQLRQQNMSLQSENSKLMLRAAGGFEALTPRPDYNKLKEEKNLEMNIFDSLGKTQLISTADIVMELFDKVIDLQKKIAEKSVNPFGKRGEFRPRNSTETESPLKNGRISKRSSTMNGLLKLTLTNQQNQMSPENDAPKSGTQTQRGSFTFTDKAMEANQRIEESPLNEMEDESVSSTSPRSNNRYNKSGFSNQKFKIDFTNKVVGENKFGEQTLKRASGIMNNLIKAKNNFKNIG